MSYAKRREVTFQGAQWLASRLTIRLSDAGLRSRTTKLIYPNHRSPPWLTEVAIPRDRSNRLLCVKATFTSARIRSPSCRRSVHFPSRATSTVNADLIVTQFSYKLPI